ncbi:MAG: hypothetical protein HZB16_07680 [Armatimonadetes bacterium]|nr:hypothetical protein [Armatimonadota bacterium]
MRRQPSLTRLGFVWLLLGLAGNARAMLPPLSAFAYNDGERRVAVQVPTDWQVSPLASGLRAQRDPRTEIGGTVVLGFYDYDQAPTPDAFLKTALDQWSARYARFQVIETSAPAERPRVRLASVSFSLDGFPCRGYVMAVIGRETGTLGFAYAEAVGARQMQLDDLVQLVVAGSYGAFPVRGPADADATQATQQAVAKLFGDADKDFKQLWKELDDGSKLTFDMLPTCGTYQPVMRELKKYLSSYLPQRPQERVADLRVYCLPTKEFNAFALGRNDLGPGFLAFHAYFTRSFAALAQQYTSLRERKLPVERFGAELTAYSAALSEAVLKGQPLPAPNKIDFADAALANRYLRVFRSMIGLVMAHEMAHYYLRHNESGGDKSPFSVQQREIAADAAAIQLYETAADRSEDLWEGGAIHAFGLFATLDNVLNTLKGTVKHEPEWTKDHPAGKTRLDMALAALGADNFKFRNDPWGPGVLDPGVEGVKVVGGLRAGGAASAFTHPVSGASIPVPEGWVGAYDESAKAFTLKPKGASSALPLAAYSCGGKYSGPSAVCDEIVAEIRKTGADWTQVKNEAFETGADKLKAHLVTGRMTLNGAKVGVLAFGLITPKMAHALLLVSPVERIDDDLKVFGKLLEGISFPT